MMDIAILRRSESGAPQMRRSGSERLTAVGGIGRAWGLGCGTSLPGYGRSVICTYALQTVRERQFLSMM